MLYQFKSIYIYIITIILQNWCFLIYMDLHGYIYIYTCIYISCKIWVFWSSIRIESFFSAFLLYFYGVSWIYMDVCIYISCKNDVFFIIFFAIFLSVDFFSSLSICCFFVFLHFPNLPNILYWAKKSETLKCILGWVYWLF